MIKKIFKKCGAWTCRALLGLIQSTNGNFNYLKIGALVGTFGLYTLLFSWQFAILLMVAVGWHESGHVWAMKRVGVPTHGFYFIPFVGGISISEGSYKNLSDKVIVAIMGPIWGMLLALVTWIAYLITDNPFLGVAAYWQSMLNLFNLMPVNPLDGGQIFRSILASFSKKVSDIFALISVIAFGAMFIFLKSPLFLFGAYLAGRDFWAHYKYSTEAHVIPLAKRELQVTIASYIILCMILLTMLLYTDSIGMANLGSLFLKG